jgi:hypothetical protein
MILNRAIVVALFCVGGCLTMPQAKVNQNEQHERTGPEIHDIDPNLNIRQLQSNCTSGSIVNGTVIKLGVACYGHLDVPGGIPSYSARATRVGVRYIFKDKRESEATSQAGAYNDWGVSAKDVSTNISFYGTATASSGIQNLALFSFSSSATEATSVVIVTDGGNKLKVTHQYKPSPYTGNLYECVVTYENIGISALTDLRYRRSLDWDLEPTLFKDCVTIDVSSASLENANNGGILLPSPLAPLTGRDRLGYSCPGPFCQLFDDGPSNIGVDVQFLLKECDNVTRKTLSPREIRQFKVYFGAADNKTAASAVLKKLPASEAVEVSSNGELWKYYYLESYFCWYIYCRLILLAFPTVALAAMVTALPTCLSWPSVN